MMVHYYVLETLHRAVDLWRDNHMRQYAHVKVNDLLAHIPYDLYERLPWVSELCRYILHSTETEGYDRSQRTTPSSVPRLEPAADAGASATRPRSGVVQNVSACLEKVWKTRGFYLTIQRLRAGGAFQTDALGSEGAVSPTPS